MRKDPQYAVYLGRGLGPLFGGEPPSPSAQSGKIDNEARTQWAREALLKSNLDTFTAEDLRQLVVQKRPHYLGTGSWLGNVFRCEWFTVVRHEQATRDEAKARWLMRYTLTAAGQHERLRRLKAA